MNRAILLATVAMAVAVGAARAADLYGTPSPYSVPVAYPANIWTGPYIGANLGYQIGSVYNWDVEPHGITGGIQAGYLWQSGQIVLGGEADIQASAAEETFAGYKFSNPWFGTIRGRVGYALNNVLVYATAGLALGQLHLEGFGGSESNLLGGWTAGLGLEVAFTQHVSVRAEYLYTDLSDTNYVLTGMNHGIESSILRFGLNYKF
ncbi:MAG: porin family protein [Xanthobacteraceae bacterium]